MRAVCVHLWLLNPDSHYNLLYRCKALTCEIWKHNLIQIGAQPLTSLIRIISNRNTFFPACLSEESTKPIARRLKMSSTNPSSSSSVLKEPQGTWMKMNSVWTVVNLTLKSEHLFCSCASLFHQQEETKLCIFICRLKNEFTQMCQYRLTHMSV